MPVCIDENQCMGCGGCINSCPFNLLKLSERTDLNVKGTRYIKLTDHEKCLECGKCEMMCGTAALHIISKENGYRLLDKEHIPPHTGCSLGNLAKALAEVINKLNIKNKTVIFKKKGSVANLLVETHNYNDDTFYDDAVKYKKVNPDKIVIIIAASSKTKSTHLCEERYRKLKDENVTIINTLNWFESDEQFTKVTEGGSHILEELAKNSNASFIARSTVRNEKEMKSLISYVEKGIKNQMDNKCFSIIEMIFPCFYRLYKRPQVLMNAEDINKINAWFDRNVKPSYEQGVLKEEI